MVKNFAISSDDECRACQRIIVGEGLRCSDCQRLNHLSCTGLPTYALVCMAVTIRTYICPECVTKKKSAQMSYEDALRKIEHLIGVEAAAAGTAVANSVAIADQIEDNNSAESTGDMDRDQTGSNRINHSVIESTVGPASGSQSVTGLYLGPEGSESGDAPSNRAVGTQNGKNQKICKHYQIGKCKHGRKGEGCNFSHPKLCRNFIRLGNRKRGGCVRGDSCRFHHPPLCWKVEKGEPCLRRNCSFLHPKGIKITQEEDLSGESVRQSQRPFPREIMTSSSVAPSSSVRVDRQVGNVVIEPVYANALKKNRNQEMARLSESFLELSRTVHQIQEQLLELTRRAAERPDPATNRGSCLCQNRH